MAATKQNMFKAASQNRKNEQERIVSGGAKAVENPPSEMETTKTDNSVEAEVSKADTTEKVSKDSSKGKAKKEKPEMSQKTNGVGRPKGDPWEKLSINIPEEYMFYVNAICGFKYNNNKSKYISSLIEKDMKENKQFVEMIKGMKG